MAETYKSTATSIGSTAATSIYAGITASGSYSLVNSINVANGSTAISNIFSVELLKGGVTAFYLINGAVLPTGSCVQILDNTLVLQTSDTLRLTAGYTASIHTIVSSLEIT